MRQSSRIAVMCNRCWFWCDTITEIIHNALIFDIYKNGCESSLSTYAYIILLLLFIFLSILFIFVVFAIFVQMAVCCFSLTLHPTKMEPNGSQSFLFGFFLSSFEIFSIFFAIYSVWWWFDMDLLFHFWGGLFRPLHTYMRSVIFHLKCHISSVYGWNVKS